MCLSVYTNTVHATEHFATYLPHIQQLSCLICNASTLVFLSGEDILMSFNLNISGSVF